MTTFHNETPWSTDDLKALIEPIIGTTFTAVNVHILNPTPGVDKEDQVTSSVETYYQNHQGRGYPRYINIHLISPKRAAARTDLLDKLSTVDEPNTAFFPPKAVSQLQHQLKLITDDAFAPYHYRACIDGRCSCPSPGPTGKLRGDTKARTRPKETVRGLMDKLSHLEDKIEQKKQRVSGVAAWLAERNAEIQTIEERRDRLLVRIEKLKVKEGV